MLILKQIFQWFLNNPKLFGLLTALVILIYLFVRIDILKGQVSELENDKKMNQQNIFALNDSLRTFKNSNNQLIYENGVLVGDKKQVGKLNEKLRDEIVKLKGEIITITNANGHAGFGSLNTEVKLAEVFGDSLFTYNWSYIDSVATMNGTTKFKVTLNDSLKAEIKNFSNVINKTIFEIAINTSIIEITNGPDKGKLVSNVYSPNPNVTFYNVNSAYFDYSKKIQPQQIKQDKWHLSVGAGYGIGVNGSGFTPLPFIGIHFGYSIFSF